MTDVDSPAEFRRQYPKPFTTLRGNGYVPLPNHGKACKIPGWNSIIVDERQAALWDRQLRWPSIGIRLTPPLLVVDIDVSHVEIAQRIRAMALEVAPQLEMALERIGAPPKVAFFALYGDEPFHARQSRQWSIDPSTKDIPRYRLEVFGAGGGARQFGCFGPHSFAPDGTVLHHYRWVGNRSPLNVLRRMLPVLTRHETYELCDRADQIFAGMAALKAVKGTRSGDSHPQTVYDLTPEMLFDVGDGETDLAGLADLLRYTQARGGPRVRVTGSFTGDPHSAGSLRCLVSFGQDKNVVIHDTKTSVTHRVIGTEPVPPDAEAINAEFSDIAWLFQPINEGESK